MGLREDAQVTDLRSQVETRRFFYLLQELSENAMKSVWNNFILNKMLVWKASLDNASL